MITYRILKNLYKTSKLYSKYAFLCCFNSLVIGFNDHFTNEKDEKFDIVGFQVILSFFDSY